VLECSGKAGLRTSTQKRGNTTGKHNGETQRRRWCKMKNVTFIIVCRPENLLL
jgi:hypothetical protein